jgi:CRP/FNR family cyclic AMP-dependent transcriptional regulator
MDANDLKRIPLFAELPRKQLQLAAHLADEIEVAEGTHLVDEGRFAHEFFVIEDGTADVVHGDEVINRLGPGDFFGEIALVTMGRRTASVVAVTPMRLVVIFGPNFNTLHLEMPDIKKRIDQVIKDRCATM